jgi:hypothetical protein
VSVSITYEATTALLYPHLMRATESLRDELRRRIVDEAALRFPDWATLKVTGPTESFDRRGNICFEYRATVKAKNVHALLQSA